MLQQLREISRFSQEIADRRVELELPTHLGMTIALEVSPRGFLDYKSIEWSRDGIEVLNVSTVGETDIVAVHIPEGRLEAFERRVQEYLDKNTKKNKPANAALIDTIESFRRAAFEELWTDESEPLPADNDARWFQLWLRKIGTPEETRARFAEQAERLGIQVEPGYLSFPGRVVVAANGTRAALEQAVELLDLIAEIRSVAVTAEFFLSDLTPAEQVDWVRNLQARLRRDGDDAWPYITLLDTGVNQGHPLLRDSLDVNDMHAVDVAWQSSDHHGHGTQMAGLALLGNLTGPLASNKEHAVPHRLESVKILPPVGQNPPHLYGPITAHAAA
ncbi:MAG: S8 family serine peptidase, partial [Arenimonas sp.]